MLAHLINPKPRVAVLGTYIDLYNTSSPGYRERMQAFSARVSAAVSAHADVVDLRLCTLPDTVEAFVCEAEDAKVDALIVLSLGYTNSLTVTGTLLRTPLPIVLFNTQMIEAVTREFVYEDMSNNHGMQGVQDIAAVLARNGRQFGIVTGLITEKETLSELAEHLIVARAKRQVATSRYASFTPPMPGMGDGQVDPKKLKEVFGVEWFELPPSLISEKAIAATDAEIRECQEFDRKHFAIDPKLTQADHDRSTRLEIALRQLTVEHKLAGFCLSFDQIIKVPGIDTQPFMGISKLMGEGVAYAGEGDILTTAGSIISRCLCDEVNFTEMYTMDFHTNTCLDTHMAEGNWRMHRPDQKPRLVRREFHLAKCEPFASIAFSCRPGPITLFSFVPMKDRPFRFVVLECDVVDFKDLEAMVIPNFKIGFEREMRRVLNDYSLMGGGHHLSMVYGSHAERLRRYAELLGCEYLEVPNRAAGGTNR